MIVKGVGGIVIPSVYYPAKVGKCEQLFGELSDKSNLSFSSAVSHEVIEPCKIKDLKINVTIKIDYHFKQAVMLHL